MRVTIVGLGLVGGSLARALTAQGHAVIGVDRAPLVRRRALAAGVVRQSVATAEEAAAEADVLVLAAPPAANVALLGRLAAFSRSGLVLTDVGSVKAPIARAAKRLGLTRFVGGHPIAGNEGSGLGASSAALFRDHAWVLIPSVDAGAMRQVRRLVKSVGARPVVMGPLQHDRALAFLSHVPQLASWALLEAAKKDPVARAALALAGTGFRDMTRLARSPRPLWREILGQNRAEVNRALAALQRALGRSLRGFGR